MKIVLWGVLAALLLVPSASAFTHMRTIEVGPNGAAESNYVFSVTLNVSTFDYANASSTGNDVRFFAWDNSTAIPYWRLVWNNTGRSTFFFQVPSLNASNATKVIMKYGDPSLSSTSNCANFTMFGVTASRFYCDEIVNWPSAPPTWTNISTGNPIATHTGGVATWENVYYTMAVQAHGFTHGFDNYYEAGGMFAFTSDPNNWGGLVFAASGPGSTMANSGVVSQVSGSAGDYGFLQKFTPNTSTNAGVVHQPSKGFGAPRHLNATVIGGGHWTAYRDGAYLGNLSSSTTDEYIGVTASSRINHGNGTFSTQQTNFSNIYLRAISVYGDRSVTFNSSSVNITPATPVPPTPTARPPIFADNGTIYGGDKAALAASLNISTTSLSALWGLFFVIGLAITGFGVFRGPGAAVGASGGVVLSVALGFWPLWLVAFVGVVMVAAWYALRGRTDGG